MQLVAEKLTLERGGRAIVRGLSLAVSSGEALLLTGANGAGKTTLLRALAGLLPVASGAIRLDGGDPERRIGEQAHAIGHLNALKGSLTVAENLAFWANYLGSPEAGAMARVRAALDRFNLAALAAIPAAYLSAGQKRRLGLARLLVADRAIWLLDEPTVSLDAASTALVAALITEHVTSGGIVVAATHVPLGLDKPRELNLSDAALRTEAA